MKNKDNFFTVWDHFIRELGSECWPSTDPKDSPFDKFTCKHCGASAEILMHGSYFIGDRFPDDRILKEHLDICPGFKLWQQKEMDKLKNG